MTGLLGACLLLLAGIAIGRAALRLLGLNPVSRLERMCYSAPIGLGVISYCVFALGLMGLLTRAAVATAIVLVSCACYRGWRDLAADLFGSGRSEDKRPRLSRMISFPAGLILLGAAVLALVNCFVPPGAHEWDALSYHLAAPKVFIEHSRIVFLPTDHHSNFPFLMEMLFTIGLLFDGYAMANLIHFLTGALTAGLLIAIGRRHFGTGAGVLAACAFAATPIVIWEAGAAYIELGMSMYVLAAFGAALEYRRSGEARWIALAGVLMGFALSVKALVLVPFALLGAGLFLLRCPLRTIVRYTSVAAIVGCPFYIKTWIVTGNPVYPFAYSLFGGRYWNADLAAAYAGEQKGFGQNGSRTSVYDDERGARAAYRAPGLLARIQNLAEAPFDLAAVPRIFYNYNDPGVHSHLGFLFLPLAMLPWLVPHVRAPAAWLGLTALAWFAVWDQTMQYVRYLIPLLPLVLLAGSWAALRLARRSRLIAGAMTLAFLTQAGLSLAHFAAAAPEQLVRATDETARGKYLASSVNVYRAEQWINTNTPPNSGVVLFEETRGFYLDRRYLWGNSPHSAYIPYDTFRNGSAMTEWFLRHGYRYGIINLQFTPRPNPQEGAQELMEAVRSRSTGSLVLKWYDAATPGERWRRLVGDAVSSGAAIIVPDASVNGTAVLEFRPARRA